VTAVVSETFVLQQLKEVIELREKWLRKERLPLNFQMRDKRERPRFLEWAKQLFHAGEYQKQRQEEDFYNGGASRRQKGKHSRWSRELQRRLGTAQLWLVVSFTGRCDVELLSRVATNSVGATQPDEEERNPQRELTQAAQKARDHLRWGEHLARRRTSGHRYFSDWDNWFLARFDSGRLLAEANQATRASGFGRIKKKDGSYQEIGPNAGGLLRTILDDFVPAVIEPDSDDND